MEYLYKLNLPPITDLVLESAKEKIFLGTSAPIHKSLRVQDTIKPEWLNFKQVPWRDLIIFYKPDFLGTIHADDWEKIRTLDEQCVWGINFIHGGSAVMEYWEAEDMDSIQKVADGVGTYNMRCVTSKPARKTYTLGPGAYLVNASAIHRVRGVGKRYAIVMRPNGPAGFTWPTLIDHFSDLII
jgi:hypothetical protein